MAVTKKQDRQGARTVPELERNAGKRFSELLGLINDNRDHVDSVESSVQDEIERQETTLKRTEEMVEASAKTVTELSEEVSSLKITADGISGVVKDTSERVGEVSKSVTKLEQTAGTVSVEATKDGGTLKTIISHDGTWESKYTKDGSYVSGLYFDFTTGRFGFDGHVVARSGEIGGCSIVDGKLQVPAANIEGTLTASQIDISVGGRNLIAGTDSTTVYTGSAQSVAEYDTFDSRTIAPPDGTEYIVSFDAKADVDQTIECFYYSPNTTTLAESSTGFQGGRADGISLVSITTEWKRYWVRWQQTPTSEPKALIVGRTHEATNVYIRAVKLEKGNTATDWTPAPEDTEATVTRITNDTIATTNVVAQNLHVKAANIDGALTFGGGSYYIDPSATTTYVKLPGVTVTRTGTDISGKITASSGAIGYWTIGGEYPGCLYNKQATINGDQGTVVLNPRRGIFLYSGNGGLYGQISWESLVMR